MKPNRLLLLLLLSLPVNADLYDITQKVMLNRDTQTPSFLIQGHRQYNRWYGIDLGLLTGGENNYKQLGSGKKVTYVIPSTALLTGATFNTRFYANHRSYDSRLGTGLHTSLVEVKNRQAEILMPIFELTPYLSGSTTMVMNRYAGISVDFVYLHDHSLFGNQLLFGIGVKWPFYDLE